MSATEPSLEPPDDAVKALKLEHKTQQGRRPFAQLLEGWELGALTVGLVLAAALLAVPRAAAPGVFPVPLVDEAEARAARERLAALADRAEREGLPFETRAVGDAVRRLGVALAGGVGDPEHLDRLIGERVHAALAAGQVDALLRLRAVQARMFVLAVRQHGWRGQASSELQALGGDFPVRAVRNGWAGPDGCVASDDELQTLFTRRWTEMTRLRDDAHFKPTLGELRRYFRFLLLYPERSAGAEPPARARASLRLRYVEALARRDTEYPVALARGSLLGELSLMPQSAQALSLHLARPGSAQWNLRARNYLLFAADGRGDASDLLPGDEP
jgi:nucleotide-binding universal stress UspA family protein